MLARVWIITASAWAASAALADPPKTQIVLNDLTFASPNTASDKIVWKPEAGGLTRYEVNIPLDGVERALKYQDTSELFYMSQKKDVGIGLTNQQNGTFSFSISPQSSTATFSKSWSPAISYHLGVDIESNEVAPSLGGSLRHVTGHTQLDQVTVSVSAQRTKGAWARARLSWDEKSETLYRVSITDGNLGASFGMRWFDFFRETDLLTRIALDEGSIKIGGQIERQFGPMHGFLGAATDLTSDEIGLVVGMQYKFGDLEVSNSKWSSEFFSTKAPSLSSVRHLRLASQWRNDIQINSLTAGKP